MRVLLLGGTTEASALAKALAEAGIDALFSYAGRTSHPLLQPLITRVGGFGGKDKLMLYLHDNCITHVIDATHPFAARMSRNTIDVCKRSKVPVLRLERPAWVPQAGDNWTEVAFEEDLPAALPDAPARVFLAIGKQRLNLFAVKPQHHYLLRLVDEPQIALPLPETSVVVARGPFTVEGDISLLREHRITHVVAKNAGGTGAQAKLEAARTLGLPVIIAKRPPMPKAKTVATVAAAMKWLGH